MLQHLTRSLSNHQIFRPLNTGSPRQDLYNHLSRLPQSARIDFEAHAVVGNLIVRIEPDLSCPAGDGEAEARIVSAPYAERVLGNAEDAVEFVRCVKLIAGSDARPFNLQLIAAHYYKEARNRRVSEVLKEMALLAMNLSSVTATEEERQFGETVEVVDEVAEGLSNHAHPPLSDRRAVFFARVAQALGEAEEDYSGILDTERRAALFRPITSSFVTDEFAAHLAEQEMLSDGLEEIDALYETYEAVYEQYDEDGLVGLHMTDGERVIVAGSLDDDIDFESVPEEARHLADELYALYTNGLPVHDRGETAHAGRGITVSAFRRDLRTGQCLPSPIEVHGLDAWLDYAIDEVFHERVARTARALVFVPQFGKPRCKSVREGIVPHPAAIEMTPPGGAATRMRAVRHSLIRIETSVAPARLHEQTIIVELCPLAAEREATRVALEILLDKMKSDCHTRGLHSSAIYRGLVADLAETTDTAVLAKLKKEAWQYKEQGTLSVKLFTDFNTRACVRQSALESEPLCELRAHRIVRGADFTVTQTYPDGGHRKFIVAQPLLGRIESLGGKTLASFAAAIHALPRQEKERVRQAFRMRNPHLYARVRDGLQGELLKASRAKLRYFRWAFYPGNKPEHPVHTLTREDQAATWELLKNLSCGDVPAGRPEPLLRLAEAAERRAMGATAAVA